MKLSQITGCMVHVQSGNMKEVEVREESTANHTLY